MEAASQSAADTVKRFKVHGMREIRRRKIRSALVTLCIFVALAVVIGILVNPELIGLAGSTKDWFVHVAPETLVEYSEDIVVARYQDGAVHETPNSSLYPDAPTSFTDVYRRFEVVESLKGTFEPGDTVYVGWAVRYTIVNADTGKPEFRSHEVPAISEVVDYALFLDRKCPGRAIRMTVQPASGKRHRGWMSRWWTLRAASLSRSTATPGRR